MATQLYFDLEYLDEVVDSNESERAVDLKIRDIRRGAIVWLFGQRIDGIGISVPTRVKRFQADLAGFWNQPSQSTRSRGLTQVMIPTRSIIVECRTGRADCWPDPARSSALLPELKNLKRDRLELEKEIREQEPELRETSTLFDEYSEWNYEGSENSQYRELAKQIQKIEAAVYKGTRFESMRDAEVADLLYLAVPEKTVHPHELADDWGLLWVDAKFNVTLVADAETRNCAPENRFHLVQNIASANTRSVLFSLGIYERSGKFQLGPVPRRRRLKIEAE